MLILDLQALYALHCIIDYMYQYLFISLIKPFNFHSSPIAVKVNDDQNSSGGSKWVQELDQSVSLSPLWHIYPLFRLAQKIV